MPSVVVTGGAGFIGSNLVDALLARGDDVHVLDNLSSGRLVNLDGALAAGATLHEVDVRDADGVMALFEQVKPEVVFHMAAQVDVRQSIDYPAPDAQTNVLGAVNVLEAARAHAVRRVINTSTGGGLYGEAELLPTPEHYEIAPLAQYGQSKHAAEGYFELYARLYGVSSLSLRYGNVYGPRQDVHGEAGVIAIFVGFLLQGRTPLVYGDGLQTRDWVEVSDVVRANLLAAGSELTGAINIGHGVESTVLDLISALQDVGKPRGLALPDPIFEPERLGEVRRSCLDNSRARSELGWAPQVELREGLERILQEL